MEKIKALLYCCKTKPYLYDLRNIMGIFGGYNVKRTNLDFLFLNGTIPCECDFEVEEITPSTWNAETERRILKGSCLKEHQLFDYIIKGDENESQNPFYALHISNLKIFDKPRELSDYYKFDGIYNDINNWKTIDKAPQNMMYAYDLISELGFSGTYNRHFEKNILISIRPERLCKILNGEKTIEVRKKVLKEVLECQKD